MAAEWFCEIDGQQHGPLTAGQLKQLATSGQLQATHPIWKEGMQKKVPARSVKGLFDAAAPKSAAPKQTWVEKNAPAADEVVDTEAVEEVVETEMIEEVFEAEAAADPPAPRSKHKPRSAAPLPQTLKTSAKNSAAVAGPMAGTSFRVLCGGQVQGPFSLDEVRHLLAAGKLDRSAMIGVETWLPVATLSLLADTTTGGLVGDIPSATDAGTEEEEEILEQEVEEVQEEEPKKEKKKQAAPAPKDESGAIPVDAEFNLDS